MPNYKQICYIANSCPSLRSLSVADNGLHSVNYCSLPSTLTVLVLEGNALESLEDLSDLCTLPNLQRLTLKRNSICRIRSAEPLIERGSPVRPSHLALTSNLTSVDFSYNKINTWSFIDSLPTVFPGMASLRVAHNPLFSSLRHPDRHQLSPEDGYLLVTARLSQLQTLNFSAVSFLIHHLTPFNRRMFFIFNSYGGWQLTNRHLDYRKGSYECRDVLSILDTFGIFPKSCNKRSQLDCQRTARESHLYQPSQVRRFG